MYRSIIFADLCISPQSQRVLLDLCSIRIFRYPFQFQHLDNPMHWRFNALLKGVHAFLSSYLWQKMGLCFLLQLFL